MELSLEARRPSQLPFVVSSRLTKRLFRRNPLLMSLRIILLRFRIFRSSSRATRWISYVKWMRRRWPIGSTPICKGKGRQAILLKGVPAYTRRVSFEKTNFSSCAENVINQREKEKKPLFVLISLQVYIFYVPCL